MGEKKVILWEDLLTTIQNKHLAPSIMLSLHMIFFKQSPTSL